MCTEVCSTLDRYHILIFLFSLGYIYVTPAQQVEQAQRLYKFTPMNLASVQCKIV